MKVLFLIPQIRDLLHQHKCFRGFGIEVSLVNTAILCSYLNELSTLNNNSFCIAEGQL